MTPQSRDINSLKTHIKHLKYAVGTTTCRTTVGVLRQMLDQAEYNLRMRTVDRNAAGQDCLEARSASDPL